MSVRVLHLKTVLIALCQCGDSLDIETILHPSGFTRQRDLPFSSALQSPGIYITFETSAS